MFEVDAQPRIDVRVEDPLSGETRRLTTYSGTAWYGGRMDIVGAINVFSYDEVNGAFFLPDSLPYDLERVAAAQISTSVGVQASGRELFRVVAQSSLVADPEGRRMAWLQFQVMGKSSVPVGLSYRVEVLGPSDLVLPPSG